MFMSTTRKLITFEHYFFLVTSSTPVLLLGMFMEIWRCLPSTCRHRPFSPFHRPWGGDYLLQITTLTDPPNITATHRCPRLSMVMPSGIPSPNPYIDMSRMVRLPPGRSDNHISALVRATSAHRWEHQRISWNNIGAFFIENNWQESRHLLFSKILHL